MGDLSVGLFTQTCVFSLKFLRFSLSSLATSCAVSTSIQTFWQAVTNVLQAPKLRWSKAPTATDAEAVVTLPYLSTRYSTVTKVQVAHLFGPITACILLFLVAWSNRGRNTTGSCENDAIWGKF